jgi:hypothetical protein
MENINFEIKILDEDHRKIDFWKFSKKDTAKFLKILNFKYSLGITIKSKKKNKDLDWMR